MHHGISRRKDMKLINSRVGISLHLVLRNYMEMMFIIVDTVADSCLPRTPAVRPSSAYYVPLHVGLLPGTATASPLQR